MGRTKVGSPNNSMQRTALRAAADAERCAALPNFRTDSGSYASDTFLKGIASINLAD
ncbi:MAG: hypothetical protein QXS54_09445 [Candidatus Methanomethylicaceae archaeon]